MGEIVWVSISLFYSHVLTVTITQTERDIPCLRDALLRQETRGVKEGLL